jgi:hypothetical protein
LEGRFVAGADLIGEARREREAPSSKLNPRTHTECDVQRLNEAPVGIVVHFSCVHYDTDP